MELNTPALLFSVLAAIALVSLSIRRSMPDAMLESLIEAMENLRGGPPTPGHPLPADDAPSHRRRRGRVRN
jgi:hypothetical protein